MTVTTLIITAKTQGNLSSVKFAFFSTTKVNYKHFFQIVNRFFAIFSIFWRFAMLKDRIRDLCRQRGIRASQVESDLGFAKGYISKLDKSNPNLSKLKALAEYFGVSVEYLVKGDQAEGYYLTAETAEIAQRVFDDPNLRLLFDAAKDVKAENIRLAAEMLLRLKETNPDG